MADSITVDLRHLPVRRDITTRIGATYRDPWTLKVNSTGTSAACSISGVTWSLKISNKRGGTSMVSAASTTAWTSTGVKVVSASQGQGTTNIIATAISAVGTSGGFWELTGTFPSGHADFPSMTIPLFEGEFTVLAKAVG